jgi:hypothetical protein
LERKQNKINEHRFSIELKSKDCVERIALPEENGSNVLIEGLMGKFQDLRFTDGLFLEIQGGNGTLRLDMRKEEFNRLLSNGLSENKNRKKEKARVLTKVACKKAQRDSI